MKDQTHLIALHERLSRERDRLERAANEQERTLRRVWIVQIEKEITAEYAFLGLEQPSIEELIKELTSP